VSEEEMMRDPFEVYARAGIGFGHASLEPENLESLAKQAMPQKAEEITRLFREGKPDIALLDGLEKTQRWPLLNDVFRTETPAEIIASALCNTAKAEAVDDKPGCIEELLRLFESAVGFQAGVRSRKWKTLRPKAAEQVLFSEFLFDLPAGAPDALSAVPRAGGDAKSVVYEACDRNARRRGPAGNLYRTGAENRGRAPPPRHHAEGFRPRRARQHLSLRGAGVCSVVRSNLSSSETSRPPAP
jgi:hypothetical protein